MFDTITEAHIYPYDYQYNQTNAGYEGTPIQLPGN